MLLVLVLVVLNFFPLVLLLPVTSGVDRVMTRPLGESQKKQTTFFLTAAGCSLYSLMNNFTFPGGSGISLLRQTGDIISQSLCSMQLTMRAKFHSMIRSPNMKFC